MTYDRVRMWQMARIKNRPKDLPQLFNKVILLMRDQCKAKKRVGIQPDINKQSKAGKTPLFLAVEFQNEVRQSTPPRMDAYACTRERACLLLSRRASARLASPRVTATVVSPLGALV